MEGITGYFTGEVKLAGSFLNMKFGFSKLAVLFHSEFLPK